MSVTFDAVGPGSAGQTGTGTSVSWSHTCTGANGLLLVGVAVDVSSGSDAGLSCSVTYNGVSMTPVQRWESGGAGQVAGFIQLFKLIAPATGAHTVAVTVTGGTPDTLAGGSLSFAGADQTAGVGTPAHSDSGGASVTSGTVTVTGTTSGNQVAAFVTCGSGSLAFTSGTSRFVANQIGGGAAGTAGGATAAAGGSVSVTWTQASDFYGAVGVEVLAAAAGGSPALAPRAGRRTAHRTPALPAVRRFRALLPVPAQLNPPFPFTELAQHRETWPRGLPRRSRLTFAVPRQLNPPVPVAEIRQQRRPRGLQSRRGHAFVPVPAQQAAPLAPAFVWQPPRHARLLVAVRRWRPVVPVTAHEHVPRQPRRPRPLPVAARRGKVSVAHLGQHEAPRQRPAPHQRPAPLRRGRVSTAVQVPAAPAPPAYPVAFQRGRPRGVRLLRGRLAQPVPAQAQAPAVPAWVPVHRAPLRALALLRRRFGQLLPWPQAAAPSFTVGTLTAATSSPVLTATDAAQAALTATGTAAAALTAGTQASGGPS